MDFKHVKVFLPYSYLGYYTQVQVNEPYIESCSYKNTYITALKEIMNMVIFFFVRGQKVSKLGKKSDFLYLITFCCVMV